MGKVVGTAWKMDLNGGEVWVVAPFLACDMLPHCRPNDKWLNSEGGYITNKEEFPDLVEGEVVECSTQFYNYYPEEPKLNPYGFIFNAQIIKVLPGYFD
jgi:hypothetical protein